MESSGETIRQAWLQDKAVLAVMAALTAEGGTARFVGGCVRDAIMGAKVRDIDIATDQPPEVVVDLLEAAELKSAPTGLSHGTVTAIAGGRGFEVTTLRRDVETDGRRATVAFTDDWLEDAKRRDFTMNALYCDSDGTVYDPTSGLMDIAEGRVRFIGNAEDRITEDALRILRFFRFHAWHGRGEIDAEGLAACADKAEDLKQLSVERVRTEFLRLLEAPAPVATLEQMAKSGVLSAILPAEPDFDALLQVIEAESEWDAPAPLRRLVALHMGAPAEAIALAKAWKLSNKDKRRIRNMVDFEEEQRLGKRDARALIYRHGAQAVMDLAIVWPSEDPAETAALVDIATNWAVPDFPLGGKDVMERGVPRSSRVGYILKLIEDEWVSNGFSDDRTALLARLDKEISLIVPMSDAPLDLDEGSAEEEVED